MISPLRKHLSITAPIYVVSQKKPSVIEAGLPAPYNCYLPLNNFTPLSLEIPSEHVDLVSCYAGLHHIPEKDINPFIDSMYRVLKKKGLLIFMEHDVPDERSKLLVSVGHSLYHLGIGTKSNQNFSQIRGFRSLKEWECLLENHGFKKISSKPLLRKGDPSKNTIMVFEKG